MSPPLIDASELASALASTRMQVPLLIDVRWRLGGPPGRGRYLAGHLPGAIYADLDHDLAGPPGRGGRHPLPDPETAVAAFRRLGVSGSRAVVVYDDTDTAVAARAWWLLRHLGHPDVRVLDGGLPAWAAAGFPVDVGGVEPVEGSFEARTPAMPVLDAEGAARVASEGVLLDARAAARYRGDEEPVDPVAGHIPGAVSLPSADTMTADGRLLPADDLRERVARLGVRDGLPVGAYCGSGVTAAHLVLALEVAGIRASLYAGSWSEWVTDPSRPVATGVEHKSAAAG